MALLSCSGWRPAFCYDVLGATFPIWVGSLGRSVADPLVRATWDEVVVAFYEGQVIWKAESVTAESLAEACTLSRGRGIAQMSTAMVESQACAAYRGARNASGSIQLVFVLYMLLGLLFGAIPLLVAYFSYLWGFFSLIIVTIMGPLLIPFALIPQTSFLFWGWIRAIISSTVQMMVGGAVFVITGTLLLVPVERFTKSLGALIGQQHDRRRCARPRHEQLHGVSAACAYRHARSVQAGELPR